MPNKMPGGESQKYANIIYLRSLLRKITRYQLKKLGILDSQNKFTMPPIKHKNSHLSSSFLAEDFLAGELCTRQVVPRDPWLSDV